MRLELISRTDKVIHKAPVLFVHCAWHGAWCWENFLPYFARQGYAAHALSLRGHGTSEGRERIRWHSAANDYVADVTRIVISHGCRTSRSVCNSRCWRAGSRDPRW